jgi:HK97 family phage major capsid protein
MDMTEIKKALDETFGPIKDAQTKTADEIRAELKTLADKVQGQDVNLIDLGQKLAGLSENGRRDLKSETIGEVFVKSDAFKALKGNSNARSARVTLEADQLKAVAPIVGDVPPNNVSVAPDRKPGIIAPGMNKVWVRDSIPVGNTTSNMVEYVREKSAQQNPDYQHPEGALKAQSDFQFELVQAPVVTIAHWLLASRQVLDDEAQLQAYLNMRMTYGLRRKEDNEILKGDGAAGHLTGITVICNQFVPTDAALNGVDNIRLAMAEIEGAYYTTSVIMLHPMDWAAMQLQKSAQGEYLFGNPFSPVAPRVWNLGIVETNSIPQGYFLCGDGSEAMIWDRQQVSVEVSREDSDNFRRNMVTILVEERLTTSVYAPGAWQYGPLVLAAGGAGVGGESTRSSKSNK